MVTQETATVANVVDIIGPTHRLSLFSTGIYFFKNFPFISAEQSVTTAKDDSALMQSTKAPPPPDHTRIILGLPYSQAIIIYNRGGMWAAIKKCKLSPVGFGWSSFYPMLIKNRMKIERLREKNWRIFPQIS